MVVKTYPKLSVMLQLLSDQPTTRLDIILLEYCSNSWIYFLPRLPLLKDVYSLIKSPPPIYLFLAVSGLVVNDCPSKFTYHESKCNTKVKYKEDNQNVSSLYSAGNDSRHGLFLSSICDRA